MKTYFNSLRPSDAIWHQRTCSSLVQLMVCHLHRTKPLPEQMLLNWTFMNKPVRNFNHNIIIFIKNYIWKCQLRYNRHFGQVSICPAIPFLVYAAETNFPRRVLFAHSAKQCKFVEYTWKLLSTLCPNMRYSTKASAEIIPILSNIHIQANEFTSPASFWLWWLPHHWSK